MSLAQQLSQLRPLMTRAEMEVVLGREQTNRALDALSNLQRDTGVEIFFSHADGVIDHIAYLGNFLRDVPVCGVSIGVTVDTMRNAVPEVRLADGETGEPNARGVVLYVAEPAWLNATLHVGVQNGEVAGIALRRVDIDEVPAYARHQSRTEDGGGQGLGEGLLST